MSLALKSHGFVLLLNIQQELWILMYLPPTAWGWNFHKIELKFEHFKTILGEKKKKTTTKEIYFTASSLLWKQITWTLLLEYV